MYLRVFFFHRTAHSLPPPPSHHLSASSLQGELEAALLRTKLLLPAAPKPNPTLSTASPSTGYHTSEGPQVASLTCTNPSNAPAAAAYSDPTPQPPPLSAVTSTGGEPRGDGSRAIDGLDSGQQGTHSRNGELVVESVVGEREDTQCRGTTHGEKKGEREQIRRIDENAQEEQSRGGERQAKGELLKPAGLHGDSHVEYSRCGRTDKGVHAIGQVRIGLRQTLCHLLIPQFTASPCKVQCYLLCCADTHM